MDTFFLHPYRKEKFVLCQVLLEAVSPRDMQLLPIYQEIMTEGRAHRS